MARLTVDGDNLELRLSWLEKAAARHADIRLPLSCVNHVSVEADWWRVLRGRRGHGVWIPQALSVGTRVLPGGTDFVVIRARRPAVHVDLQQPSPYARLAVTVPDPR